MDRRVTVGYEAALVLTGMAHSEMNHLIENGEVGYHDGVIELPESWINPRAFRPTEFNLTYLLLETIEKYAEMCVEAASDYGTTLDHDEAELYRQKIETMVQALY